MASRSINMTVPEELIKQMDKAAKAEGRARSDTDCTSFAVMKRVRIHGAFTFDHHFQQFGFETFPSILPVRRK